jgi:predicted DNA-binding transcriptional regulator YafY
VVVHRVAPYQLLFRDGHTYLDAYCHDCGLPEYGQRFVLYRLDRIVAGSIVVLADRLPPTAPARRRYPLRYTLSAAVTRQRDIALWFPHSEVRFRDDGSALVLAETSDLWQARQILLRYREHCRVLEPPELVAMLRESVERMALLYHATET